MPLEREQVTQSGIVLPDTATGEKPSEGIVLALGKGGTGEDMTDPTKLKTEEGKEVEVKVLRLDSVLGKVV